MQRPEPHEIDTRAQRIFEYKLPDKIVVRRQASDDYGIDAEIEWFQDGHSTGTIFKVQLKGKKSPEVATDGTTISYNFPVRKGTYLIEQIEIPTVFILVDVTKELVYWCDIHSNQELITSYYDAKNSGRDSFTFYFYTNHTLPDTLSTLLDTIVTSANHTALRHVSKIKPPAYLGYVINLSNVENELNHLSQKFEVASAEKLRRLLATNEFDEAEALIDRIIASPERSNESKFDALLCTERIFVNKYGGQKGDITKAEFDTSLAEDLTKLADGSSIIKLKLLAKAFTLSAQLFSFVEQDRQLFFNWRLHHDQSGNATASGRAIPLWLTILELERTRVYRMLWETYEELGETIAELIEKDWTSVPDLVTRVVFSMNVLLLRLNEEKLSETIAYVSEAIDGLIKFIVPLTEKISEGRVRDAIFDRCVIAYEMQLTIYRDDQNRKQSINDLALEMTERIANQQVKEAARLRLAESYNKGEELPTQPEKNWEALAAHFKKQAKTMGVDFDLVNKQIYDVRDPRYHDAQLARIIDIGLRDLNPTRVFVNCKHLIYRYHGGMGELPIALGLDSARSKLMACVLHLEHGAISGYSLDSIHQTFREKYCSKCPHAEPREPSWEYSTEWHNNRIAEWQRAHTEFKNKQQK